MPMQPLNRDEVLALVKSRGPIIPNELKKLLKQGDTVLLGAMLSELASKGLVKISSTKIGGSPFYYDPAQPEKLETVIQHLNEKDQRTARLLKEKKVLRDDEQEMLIRVSFRNIKDFAVQLSAGEDGIAFFKYYLVPDEEAEQIIRRMLGVPASEVPQGPPIKTPTGISSDSERAPEEKPVEKEIEKPKAVEKPAEKPAPKEQAPKQEARDDDEFIAIIPEPEAKPKAEAKGETKAEAKAEKPAKAQKPAMPVQQPLPGMVQQIQDEFYDQVKKFFDENGILVKEQKLLKKGELDLVILVPTPVGSLEYFCKAKSKKKNSDGDLAAAKLEGQSRSLPVLYLTSGEVAKKAKEALATTLRGVVVKELSA